VRATAWWGPGVVPGAWHHNNLDCQTALTGATGAKGKFLRCQTDRCANLSAVRVVDGIVVTMGWGRIGKELTMGVTRRWLLGTSMTGVLLPILATGANGQPQPALPGRPASTPLPHPRHSRLRGRPRSKRPGSPRPQIQPEVIAGGPNEARPRFFPDHGASPIFPTARILQEFSNRSCRGQCHCRE
jgi:hypothetical protein